MIRIFTSLALVSGLASCGVAYTSPGVEPVSAGDASGPGVDVNVVPMSFASVASANTVAYAPRRLPAAFHPRGTGIPPRLSAPSDASVEIQRPEIRQSKDYEVEQVALPQPSAEPATPEAQETRVPPAAPVRPYRIGVADVLLLSANAADATLDQLPGLISAQSKRQGYIVQDDGAIAVPDVGRVDVSGLTMKEAEEAIFERLVERGLDPTFSLEIAEFNSQRVSVGGAVRTPTIAPISLKPLYLHEALEVAGGVNARDADYTAIRLYRGGELYQIPLRDFYADPSFRDVLLRDGDSVFVDTSYEIEQAQRYFNEQLQLRQAEIAEREFAFRQRELDFEEVRFATTLQQFELARVQLLSQTRALQVQVAQYNATRGAELRAQGADQRAAFADRLELGAVKRDYAYLAGEVEKQSRFPLPFENTAVLADILFEAGGAPIQTADWSQIYVIRSTTTAQGLSGVTAYHLNAENAANLALATQMELRPNDVVFVSEQPITAWNRVLTQSVPTVFTAAAGIAVR